MSWPREETLSRAKEGEGWEGNSWKERCLNTRLLGREHLSERDCRVLSGRQIRSDAVISPRMCLIPGVRRRAGSPTPYRHVAGTDRIGNSHLFAEYGQLLG